jgi:hypothetical protein
MSSLRRQDFLPARTRIPRGRIAEHCPCLYQHQRTADRTLRSSRELLDLATSSDGPTSLKFYAAKPGPRGPSRC